MASTFFGVLSNLDHNIHTWKTYKGRLLQWFITNDIDKIIDPTGIKRRAVLFSALNEDTYKFTADLALPKEIHNVPFDDIVALLDAHFTPKQLGLTRSLAFALRDKVDSEIGRLVELGTSSSGTFRIRITNSASLKRDGSVRMYLR
ncbi:unnamed protein product [Diatraea saccharalis]|uniref:Uncharacterized protein n=1 Tax=Diatraea saccharalis TaxID=40085 RepID=A0A9N9R5I6_9NEOP|nr:unnamed protein product [Diatraea saccharalis]